VGTVLSLGQFSLYATILSLTLFPPVSHHLRFTTIYQVNDKIYGATYLAPEVVQTVAEECNVQGDYNHQQH
jgi:hypothetical protein